jgi:hypothetical protein
LLLSSSSSSFNFLPNNYTHRRDADTVVSSSMGVPTVAVLDVRRILAALVGVFLLFVVPGASSCHFLKVFLSLISFADYRSVQFSSKLLVYCVPPHGSCTEHTE